MPLSLTMLDADLAMMTSDLTQVVTIAGKDYPCIATDGKENPSTLTLSGMLEDFAIAFLVRSGLLAALPAQDDVVTYAGSEYRILSIDSSTDGIHVQLNCGALTQ